MSCCRSGCFKASPHWASHASCGFAGWEIFYSLRGSWSGEIGSLNDGKHTPARGMIFCINILNFALDFSENSRGRKASTSRCGFSIHVNFFKHIQYIGYINYYFHPAFMTFTTGSLPINPTKSAKITPNLQLACQAQCGAALKRVRVTSCDDQYADRYN